MSDFKEKRKYSRFKKKGELVANLYQKKDEAQISYNIPFSLVNVSRQGFMAIVPKSWECSKCVKCSFWMFNQKCELKINNGNGDQTKPIPIGCALRLRSQGPQIQEVNALVVWVKYSQSDDAYKMGLRFSQETPSLPFS
tara:strand:+ start:43 stop:459 length:417 start_codon:yes stop_codon:yes gene_type:complete